MKIPNYISKIMATLEQAGYSAYLVGGCVRDAQLGEQPQDYDLATSAPAERVLSLFPKTVRTGLKHGTVTVISPEGTCEVTTFRQDGPYKDKRRPAHVHYIQTIESDLARRDFTMNAIAFDGQRYIDPFEGRADLKLKLIRAVGNPAERFNEDALRLLRAVRFAAQFQFTIEPGTKAAIKQSTHLLHSSSAERIRDELSKLLLSKHPAYGLELMLELGLFAIVFPELAQVQRMSKQASASMVAATYLKLIEYTPAQLAVRLAALLHQREVGTAEEGVAILGSSLLEAQRILKRLRFSRRTIAQVSVLLRELPTNYGNYTPIEVKKFITRVGPGNLEPLFQLQLAGAKAALFSQAVEEILQMREKVNKIMEENQPLTVQDLAITGQDLINLGIKEGPDIGKTLHALWELVLEEINLNQKETLLKLAKEEINSSNK